MKKPQGSYSSSPLARQFVLATSHQSLSTIFEPMAAHDILTTPAVRAPPFPTNLDWINTGGRALTLDALRGKVILLDFWTYG